MVKRAGAGESTGGGDSATKRLRNGKLRVSPIPIKPVEPIKSKTFEHPNYRDSDVKKLGPFEEPTQHRTFKIIVEGKTVFVNPHLLAEMSPFFETLCLGNFKEGIEGKAELKEVKYDDFIEMLNVLGADFSRRRKEIEASNCIPMMRLAHRWAIDNLMMRCTDYIERRFSCSATTITFTLELLLACEELQIGGKPLRTVASRLASFPPDLLLFKETNRKIKDPSLSAAIFVAANKDYEMKDCDSHLFRITTPYKSCPCEAKECVSKETRECTVCQEKFCRVHASARCFDRMHDAIGMTKRFGAKPVSPSFAPLDRRFFGLQRDAL